MKRSIVWVVWIFSSLFFLWACAGPSKVVVEPRPFPEGFLNARWGMSIDEVKKAISQDGHECYQDRLEAPSYVAYASGRYLDTRALLSYFFSPKSKKLYRVDVTFDDVRIHGKARDHLIARFGKPTYSSAGGDHWSWRDKSVVILQLDQAHVQMSYFSGPWSIVNYEERTGCSLP